MHVVQMTDNGEEGNACDCRRRHGSVIKSLGEDTRTALVAGRTPRTCANGRDITTKANGRS